MVKEKQSRHKQQRCWVKKNHSPKFDSAESHFLFESHFPRALRKRFIAKILENLIQTNLVRTRNFE